MSAVNPNILVVQSLPFGGATEGFDQARADLIAGGVRPLLMSPDAQLHTAQYDFAVKEASRAQAQTVAEEQRHLLGRAGGLLVVNDIAERVDAPDGSRICGVPNSVGYLATQLMRVANDVYGPNSGRVFLSNSYPDGTDLFSTQSSHRSVVMARTRLLSVYPLRPIALRGDMGPAIATVKGETHRTDNHS
jgi:hypothetical protein